MHPPYDHDDVDGVGTIHDGINLGHPLYEWDTVYANNSSIQSSDQRNKTEIKDCDLGLDFIKNLRPVNFKWKGNGKRVHYGLTAQEVKTALIASGKKFEGNYTDEFAGYINVYDIPSQNKVVIRSCHKKPCSEVTNRVEWIMVIE